MLTKIMLSFNKALGEGGLQMITHAQVTTTIEVKQKWTKVNASEKNVVCPRVCVSLFV